MTNQTALSRYGVEPAPQKHDPVYEDFEHLRSAAAGADFQQVLKRVSTWTLAELSTDDYPEVEGFGYEVPEEKGPATVAELWRRDPKSYWDGDYDHENIPSTAGIFVNNADEYVQEFALDALDFAEYYSRMEDLPYQFRYSADCRTHISPHFIQKLVRLSNGKGRIDVEQTELILCGTGSVVTAGPRGVFWARIPTVTVQGRDKTPLPEPPDPAIHEVGGRRIAEEDPRLRAAMEQLFELAAHPDLPTLESYRGLAPRHEFRTREGETVLLGANSLRLIGDTTDTVADILGTHRTTAGGKEHTVTVGADDVAGNVGEVAELDPEPERADGQQLIRSADDRVRGVVGGYRIDWREVRPGFGTEGVAKVVPRLETIVLQPDLSVEVVTTPLATIEV